MFYRCICCNFYFVIFLELELCDLIYRGFVNMFFYFFCKRKDNK